MSNRTAQAADATAPTTLDSSILRQRRLFQQRLPGIGVAPSDAARLRDTLDETTGVSLTPENSSPVTPLLSSSPVPLGTSGRFLSDDTALAEQSQGGNWRVRKLDLEVLGALPTGSAMIVRRHSSPWLMVYNNDEVIMEEKGLRGRTIDFLPDGDELREVPALVEALKNLNAEEDVDDQEPRGMPIPGSISPEERIVSR